MSQSVRARYLVCLLLWLFSHCSRPDNSAIQPDPQAGQTELVSRVGGLKNEQLTAIVTTRDRGFLAVGEYDSLFSIGRTYRGFVVRLDSLGQVISQQKIAMPFASVVQTQDGGFWLGAKYTGALVRLDEQGRYVRTKALDDTGVDGGSAIYKLIRATDGGYIGVGYTNQAKFNASLTTKETAGFVFKIDEAGTIVWFQTLYFRGTINIFQSLTPTTDGGYVLAGRTTYNYGDPVTNPPTESIYGWLVKLTAAGQIVWHKAIPGRLTFNDINETTLGELMLTGVQAGPPPAPGVSYATVIDGWIGHFSSQGTLLGQQRYGGDDYDNLSASIKLPTGDYLNAGGSTTTGTVGTGPSKQSAWLLQTNVQGVSQHTRLFNSSPITSTYDIVVAIATNGRRYVAVGKSSITTSSEPNDDGLVVSISQL